jgi:tetratricopeptide (TPR) repeat protein
MNLKVSRKLYRKGLPFLFALCLLSIGFSQVAFGINLQEKANFELGLDYLNQNNYMQAQKYFNKVIVINPDNALAHYNLAVILKNLGKTEEAEAEYKLAMANKTPSTVFPEEMFQKTETAGLNTEVKPTEQISSPFKASSESERPKVINDFMDRKDTESYSPRTKQADSQKENDYVDIAEVYYDNFDYKSAIEYYGYALNNQSDNDYCLYKTARSYLAMKDFKQAQKNIEKALKINPSKKEYLYFQKEIKSKLASETGMSGQDDPSYNNEMGVSAVKSGDAVKAENYFKKASETDPKNSKSYNNLSYLEYQKNNLDKALQYSQKAVENDSLSPESYFNQAMIYKKKKDIEKELENLNKTLELNPDFYSAYYERGLVFYNNGDNEKAKEDFNKVLSLKSSNLEANYNLGIISAKELNMRDAVKYFKKAISLNNKNTDAYIQLASVYQADGKLDEALANYLQALSLAPQGSESNFNLGKIYFSRQDYENAKKYLAQAEKSNPRNADLYNYLGLVSQGLDEYAEAKEYFLKAIGINPDRPVYHYNLSQCYLSLDDNDNSMLEFHNAVNATPVKAQDYIDLAEIYYDKDMPDYSVKSLKDGIKNFPSDGSIYIALASIYERQGNMNSAKETLESLLKANSKISISKKIKEKIQSLDAMQ